MQSLKDIESKAHDLSYQANLFADLCDIVELTKYYACGNKKCGNMITSGIILITQEARRIAEMCGDIHNDILKIT